MLIRLLIGHKTDLLQRLLSALWTMAVGELRVCVLPDVSFQLLPYALLIADLGFNQLAMASP